MEKEINQNTNAYVYEQLLKVNENKFNVIMNEGMFDDLNKNKNPYKRLEGFIDEELLADYFGKTIEEFDDMIVAEEYYPQNYECWYIKLIDGESFTYNNNTYFNGDFIFYYNGEWIYIPNVDMYNEDDLARHKYLSALTNRFLPSYLINNFPYFVQFIREYLKICDNTWYKIICNIADYANIDKMPDDVLVLAVSQYAISFTPNLKNIKYFYDSEKKQYKYDNIRNFLRISRKYLSCKGTAQSIFFLYDMIFYGESNVPKTDVEIIMPYDRMLRVSDYRSTLKESKGGHTQSGISSEEVSEDKSEIQYIYPSTISGKENVEYYTYEYGVDEEKSTNDEKVYIKHFYDNLSHLHGTDVDDIDDMGEEMTYGYFTVLLHHNLENPKEFAEMFEELVKPTGVKMVWKKMNKDNKINNKNGSFEIYNEDEDMKIYPYNLFDSATPFCNKEEISFRLLNVNKNDPDSVMAIPLIETTEQALNYITNNYYEISTPCYSCLKRMMTFNKQYLYKSAECMCNQCPLFILNKDESVTIEFKVDGRITDTNLIIMAKDAETSNTDKFSLMEYMNVYIEGNSSTK